MNYTISKVPVRPDEANNFWRSIPTDELSYFLPQSSDHRPRTEVRLCHDLQGIHGLFEVEDRFVRCVRTDLEAKCGKMVAWSSSSNQSQPGVTSTSSSTAAALFWSITSLTQRALRMGSRRLHASRKPSLGRCGCAPRCRPSSNRRFPKRSTWELEFFLPFTLLENYVGRLGEVAGQTWRGNFYKCAEENSHPHWAAWSPVDDFNFHRPDCFGELRFA